MQLDKIRYNWLITNIPHISFSSQYDWQRWLKTLTQYERRMNISGIEQSRDMIEDDFDNYAPETEEFQHLLVIHMRLIELLFVIKN